MILGTKVRDFGRLGKMKKKKKKKIKVEVLTSGMRSVFTHMRSAPWNVSQKHRGHDAKVAKS